MSVKDFCLTQGNVGYLVTEIYNLLREPGKWRVTIVKWREKRSLSQNALQHVIYSTISRYLKSKGRDWCEKKVKSELKNKFLGWEVTEFTDVVTGEITKRETLVSTSNLDVDKAYLYTTQIIEWAEWIGCEIKIPAKCEYRELMESQYE